MRFGDLIPKVSPATITAQEERAVMSKVYSQNPVEIPDSFLAQNLNLILLGGGGLFLGMIGFFLFLRIPVKEY